MPLTEKENRIISDAWHEAIKAAAGERGIVFLQEGAQAFGLKRYHFREVRVEGKFCSIYDSPHRKGPRRLVLAADCGDRRLKPHQFPYNPPFLPHAHLRAAPKTTPERVSVARGAETDAPKTPLTSGKNPENSRKSLINWSPQPGSNQRHPDYKSGDD